MLGKTLSSKSLAYRGMIWLVIAMVMIGATGCGDTPTPTAEAPQPTGPTPTATLVPTSTPLPTATPTEIPIILPTPTPPNPILPPTQPFYQPALTQAPTYTPVPTYTPIPTSTPAPSVTPYAPPLVVPLGIYSVPELGPYYRLDYVAPPSFTTQCIAAQYFPAPTPTPTPPPPGFPTPAPTFTPNLLPNIQPAEPTTWLQEFNVRWFSDARRNSVLIPAPTFTPVPTSTPLPTNTPVPSPTPLPFNTPDVFTGLTPVPLGTSTPTPAPTNTPVPTKVPPVPTWTPSLNRRFNPQGDVTSNLIQSVYISDVVPFLSNTTQQPTNMLVMWQVMNDMTLALVNPDTPVETYERAYEQNLDKVINIVLSRSLKDLRLPPTGEQRYANRKIIIGNVPDLRAFRYYTPCFTADRLKTIQNEYNTIINRVAAKYPGRVYVADLTTLDWVHNPQWVSTRDGLRLTIIGADAVADVFGRVFERILPTL